MDGFIVRLRLESIGLSLVNPVVADVVAVVVVVVVAAAAASETQTQRRQQQPNRVFCCSKSRVLRPDSLFPSGNNKKYPFSENDENEK